ncbi:hypothetical protein [Picosynechococcus sp. NKBG042902]|nr:hypothetical protein [Picosynechococcus sp. NKBG042902]
MEKVESMPYSKTVETLSVNVCRGVKEAIALTKQSLQIKLEA